MTVASIETRYAGCRFRSRLEARWAVFFDRLNLTWEYEPQGFNLHSGNYLPDFKIRFGATDYVWWEVKGNKPTRNEIELAWELHEATGKYVYIAHGDIPRDQYEQPRIAAFGAVRCRWHLITPTQGKPLIGFTPVDADDQTGIDHPLLLAAYIAARSARFEHGEIG